MWEIERRGYLQFGSFIPEVVIEKPSVLKALHEEFVYCGSDVVEAFTVFRLYFTTAKLHLNSSLRNSMF